MILIYLDFLAFCSISLFGIRFYPPPMLELILSRCMALAIATPDFVFLQAASRQSTENVVVVYAYADERIVP